MPAQIAQQSYSNAVGKRAIKTIDLALQGGGAHGAFTWGVLERILEEERIEIVGVSGTSAGAMNAVALAAGLMQGGRKGARETLRRFWAGVGAAARFSPLNANAFGALFGNWMLAHSPMHVYLDIASRMVSPYQFNPYNLNPLRSVLVDTVDFAQVRACHKVRLFIAATHVRSGKLRVFRHEELTAEAVLASACLPLLFQAVEVGGEPYWDGGYMGNPSLLPLISESPAQDLLLVQVNPSLREAVPTNAQAILDRINEITFNGSLIKEMRAIALLKKLIRDEGQPGHHYREPLFAQVDSLRLHRIDAQDELAHLGAASKLNTAWGFLQRLHRIGHDAADRWLARSFTHLGRRSTLDPIKAFLQ